MHNLKREEIRRLCCTLQQLREKRQSLAPLDLVQINLLLKIEVAILHELHGLLLSEILRK